MTKLCFGTFFTLLCKIKVKMAQEEFYSILCQPLCKNVVPANKGSVGERKSGRDDFTGDEKKVFVPSNRDKVISSYKIRLRPKVFDSKLPGFYAGLRKLLIDDPISFETPIGFPPYTKDFISKNKAFDFEELCFAIMCYLANIDSKHCESFVDEMDSPEFFEDCQAVAEREALGVVMKPADIACEISTTIASTDFDKVFKRVASTEQEVGTPAFSPINLYRLELSGNSFLQTRVSDFIAMNIGRYVFSRTKRKDMENEGKSYVISLDAMKAIKKASSETSLGKAFTQIMLYSFLETSLKARKLFSAVELEKVSSFVKSKSAGVYLLPAGVVGPTNQIVFGCSQAFSSLIDAFNASIAQAHEICSHIGDEIRVLDPSVLKEAVSSSEFSYIEKIIVPEEGSNEPEKSFGIFVAYTVMVSGKGTMSSSDYRKRLEEKMDKDILDALPTLRGAISAAGLNPYAFYFYVMPLDDAEKEPVEIMNEAMGND